VQYVDIITLTDISTAPVAPHGSSWLDRVGKKLFVKADFV